MTRFDPATFAWSPMVPELLVSDITASLAFWCDLLGFTVAYDRPTPAFAYLERDGAQLMLCARTGEWETGPMEPPFGRGLNLQITVPSLEPILAALTKAGIEPYEPPAEKWRRTGDGWTGAREFLVQDPDGYLVRICQPLGPQGRPPGASAE
jgi:catechol 2,3-dioxygenase-like lactoylglutathione lyase family enzyme